MNQYRPDIDGGRASASKRCQQVNRPRGQHILPLAELLLVDGDPLANLYLVADPGRNFVSSASRTGRRTRTRCVHDRRGTAGSRGIDASTTRYRRARPRHRPTRHPA